MNNFQEWCKKAYPFVVAGMNGKKVEFDIGGGVWKEKIDKGLHFPGNEYRIAPKTIKVNGHDVPAPEKEAPVKSVYYWVPDLDSEQMFLRSTWDGDNTDKRRLERGLVHLNQNAVIAHTKAMLDVGGSK